ncbi:MAG: alpha/beta fold hydrolase [Pseudomonadota bacterium]
MLETRHKSIDISVDHQHIAGTLVASSARVPGVLLVHGWDGNQQQYLARAHELAALGCVCLTFDLRGHARHVSQRQEVTREDNLRDVLAAYDVLAAQPGVDPGSIAIIGSSYGGYLAAIATQLRAVRWLALRVPALYRDEEWNVPKGKLSREDLAAYRLGFIDPETNRALQACAEFRGDALIVESEFDKTVPHPVIANYLGAFRRVRSVTYRVISGADHALSNDDWRHSYGMLLTAWMTEMTMGARAAPGTVRTPLKNAA